MFEKKDLFEDLRDEQRHVLESKKDSLMQELKAIESRLESAKEERNRALGYQKQSKE